MRYSLISRFRGTLIGATIGEKITQKQQSNPSTIANLLISGTQSLVDRGRFDRESWQEDLLLAELTPIKAIAATLPLALFYHDNEIKLRQNLLSASSILPPEKTNQAGILAVGYAIAQAITEKLDPSKLIPQILEFIDEPNTDFSSKLMQVQWLLAQKAGVEKTLIPITANCDRLTASVALGFYYFLSSPEEFNLSIKRSKKSPTSAPIVGALAGAYNSSSNIPSSCPIFVAPTNLEREMLQLSDSLVAVWSGVYDRNASLGATAVAAPRVIRFR